MIIAVFSIPSLISSIYAQSDEQESRDDSAPINFSRGQGNWTTYTSELFGISFDYPSGWNVSEKQDRFDDATDVSVSKGYMKFGVSKTLDRPADNPLKSSDIGEITRGIEQVTEKDKEMSIVEPMDVKKYTVGAEKSGTFIVKFKVGVAQTGLQLTYVVHNGDLYLLSFQDSTSTFDSPETQSILNKLIQSFRFLS